MKVFISWSGETSKRVAELFHKWIQPVIQQIDPWISSTDIEAGTSWISEINDALGKSNVGVIFLTVENRTKPWVLFEAGAISKGLTTTRACPFLIKLKKQDVDRPLSDLHLTEDTEEGMLKLLQTINNAMSKEQRLSQELLTETFKNWWQKFKEPYDRILEQDSQPVVKRSTDEILEEILLTVRNQQERIKEMEHSLDGTSEIVLYLREKMLEEKRDQEWDMIMDRLSYSNQIKLSTEKRRSRLRELDPESIKDSPEPSSDRETESKD